MKQGLLIFLLICAMCAMARRIPRIPRAVEVEEKKTPPQICAYNTPCAWSFYKTNIPDLIDLNVTNIYCTCGIDTTCLFYENDDSTSTMVYRCQKEKS